MPFFPDDGNGRCCWCHKGKATHMAWDWMICHKCFTELEMEAGESGRDKKRERRVARRQKQDALSR